jgi:hypothetical protein
MSQSAAAAGSIKPSSRALWAALPLGALLAAIVLWALLLGPLAQTAGHRYVKHPVECVEVVMFCCALCVFGGKWWQSTREKRALRTNLLPRWDGKPVPASMAGQWQDQISKWPGGLQTTWFGCRVRNVLRFVHQRGGPTGLDDQLRALADGDALALDASYALTRFITWAIPILGFLGTVLGITHAISGVTPEVLEKSLSTVTDGLALAFDTTALGLALTMITMFVNFLVERREQTILEAVDRLVDEQLAHRFGSVGRSEDGPVRQQTEVILNALEQVLQRQHQQFAGALQAVLQRTAEIHAQNLREMELRAVEHTSQALQKLTAQAGAVCESGREQQSALARIMQAITSRAQNLMQVQEAEKELLGLQQTLNQNLQMLAGAGTFEQAVHSLTAAIHLLTTRASALPDLHAGNGRKTKAAA